MRVPVLAVNKGEGVLIYLDLESREGNGNLFLDVKLMTDKDARKAINYAFSLLKINKRDIFIRAARKRWSCLCGPSLGLPIYLGMSALFKDLKFKPNVFATGCIDNRGNVTPVGCLAEKIMVVLKKATRLLVPQGQGLLIEAMEVVEISTVEEAEKAALT